MVHCHQVAPPGQGTLEFASVDTLPCWLGQGVPLSQPHYQYWPMAWHSLSGGMGRHHFIEAAQDLEACSKRSIRLLLEVVWFLPCNVCTRTVPVATYNKSILHETSCCNILYSCASKCSYMTIICTSTITQPVHSKMITKATSSLRSTVFPQTGCNLMIDKLFSKINIQYYLHQLSLLL